MEKTLCLLLFLSTSHKQKLALCTDIPISTGFGNYSDRNQNFSGVQNNDELKLMTSKKTNISGPQRYQSKLENQRCMIVKERDYLECGTYEEKMKLGKTSLLKVRDRWNSLHCSTVDKKKFIHLCKYQPSQYIT